MDNSQIKILIHSEPRAISKLYNAHRDLFLNFGKKYGLDYDDLADIYQEAFIALREKAVNGKLYDVKSTLRTYLFGIGKFMIFDMLKQKQKTTTYEPTIHTTDDTIEPISLDVNEEELTIEQSLLKTFFKKLGKKCQEMLTMFYARGLTIDEIVEISDYTSGSVVRSQKSRCIKSLKEMIKS